jgi:hypothetical protein
MDFNKKMEYIAILGGFMKALNKEGKGGTLPRGMRKWH